MALPVAAAVAQALVHLLAGGLRFLRGTPRSVWLSTAGGVSVAYVFVHVLPELAEGQEAVRQAAPPGLRFLENHVYLVALLGLGVFYGLERAAVTSRRHQAGGEDAPTPPPSVFWLHIGSFAVYNALIGYLLLRRREESDATSLLLFSAAMAMHFVVNDFGLREHHKGLYDRVGRWVLAVAILAGWGIGRAAEIGEAALAVLFAFLAGGVMLNVLKEELPEERESRFWAFAAGAAGYTALLLAL